ncbi:MAG: hypothetical protein VYC95_08310 [Verrucomicrobiota bacterium]|nr:hypothetical protein [Verrucomicrobiota bacterium]
MPENSFIAFGARYVRGHITRRRTGAFEMEVCNVHRSTSQTAKPCAQRMFLVFCLALSSSVAGWANEPPEDAVLATLPFQRPEEPNRVYIDLAPEGRTP